MLDLPVATLGLEPALGVTAVTPRCIAVVAQLTGFDRPVATLGLEPAAGVTAVAGRCVAIVAFLALSLVDQAIAAGLVGCAIRAESSAAIDVTVIFDEERFLCGRAPCGY